MFDRKVFRSAALERLSTPERLDELVEVTSPRSWIALLSLVLLVIALVTWGVFGRISTRVPAQGILMGGSVADLAPMSTGQLRRVRVRAGDVVHAGDVVAELDQPEIAQQLDDARAKLAELESQQRELQAFGAENVQLRLQVARQQRANLEQSIRAMEDRLAELARQAATEEQLLKDGLITRPQLAATQQALASLRSQLESSRTELKEISSRELGARFDSRQQVALGQQRIAETKRLVEQLESELSARSLVTSPYSGRVLELLADRGDMVNAGVPMIKLGLGGASDGLRVLLYVRTADGKKIRRGMRVRVSPATVKPEEYGYLVAEVTGVSDFPATTRGMQHVLKHEGLVAQLSADGAPFEVAAKLFADSAAPSGFRWTSRGGPPVGVYSGTPVTGAIVTTTERPVSLVLPWIRRQLAID